MGNRRAGLGDDCWGGVWVDVGPMTPLSWAAPIGNPSEHSHSPDVNRARVREWSYLQALSRVRTLLEDISLHSR